MRYWLIGYGIILCSLVCAQNEYQDSVMVLKDGRIIAMRGDYEVIGDEVQFLDDRGERVALPSRLVDFVKTDDQNKRIREKAKDRHVTVDDGSLYAKVMRNREATDGPKKKIELVSGSKANQQGKSSNKTVIEIPKQKRGNLNLDTEAMRRQLHDFIGDMQENFLLPPAGWLALLAVFGILALISFITEIYLVYNGYQDSLPWGLTLTFFMLGSFFAPFIAGLVLGVAENPMILMILNGCFGLARILFVILYIVLVYTGSRMKVFLLWSSPLWFALITGIGLAIMTFF